MAESPLDRLKRLAAEKKAGVSPVAQPVVVAETASGEAGALMELESAVAPITTVLTMQIPVKTREELTDNDRSRVLHTAETGTPSQDPSGTSSGSTEVTGGIVVGGVAEKPLDGTSKELSNVSDSNSLQSSTGNISSDNPGNSSSHPLAMQFAELESALLATDPEFKTILRQIHRHLGQEPELVTQMTEQEIQMVVQGLIVFANAEVVAPAAAKTAKAKIAAAKKQVISADDL